MLTREQRGDMLTAIYEYALSCELPEIDDPLVKMAFVGIAKRMEHDNDKYFATCDKNKLNIQKRWDEKKKKDAAPSNTTVYERIPSNATVYESIRTDTKNTDMDMDKDMELGMDMERDYNAHARVGYNGAVTSSNREGTTAHGQYKNVYITKAEHAELIGEFGEVRTNSTIERLSVYIKTKGDKYCNHSAVIRQWATEDAANKSDADGGFETEEYFKAALNRSKRYLNDTKVIETSTDEEIKPP